jgi:hypothetical protein
MPSNPVSYRVRCKEVKIHYTGDPSAQLDSRILTLTEMEVEEGLWKSADAIS